MIRFLFSIIVLGAITPSTIFCQSKNSFGIQTGLFHSFFDKSPLLNFNYQNSEYKPFNGLFYNSVGLHYKREIKLQTAISIEYMYYYEEYLNVHPNLLKNVMFKRGYNTFNVTYERIHSLKSKLSYSYGGGLNYRIGSESVVLNYGYFPVLNFYESLLETRILKDIGINLRSGIDYSPTKWLTFFSKLDIISFLYLNDKETIKKLRDSNGYNYKSYPHRFDLSWRFGIGFNF